MESAFFDFIQKLNDVELLCQAYFENAEEAKKAFQYSSKFYQSKLIQLFKHMVGSSAEFSGYSFYVYLFIFVYFCLFFLSNNQK